MKIQEIKGKPYAIHFATKQEQADVLNIMEANGIKWAGGKKATERHMICDCLLLEPNSVLMQCPKSWIEDEYTVITASQFLAANK